MSKYLITPSLLLTNYWLSFNIEKLLIYLSFFMRERENITGKKYGFLTAIKFIRRDKTHYYWLFKCDCGKEKIMDKTHVKTGHSKSCGCKVAELCRKFHTKHGHTSNRKFSKEFSTWAGMLDRCFNKNNNHFKNYGGRGITVCNRWKSSFQNFFDDMGVKPYGKSLDRIDNNGNYELSNCRWATHREQQNNRTNNNILELYGQKDTMSNWCRKFGITTSLFDNRKRLNWSIEKIFTTPKRKLCKKDS